VRSEAVTDHGTRGTIVFPVGDVHFGARVEEVAGLLEADRLAPLPRQHGALLECRHPTGAAGCSTSRGNAYQRALFTRRAPLGRRRAHSNPPGNTPCLSRTTAQRTRTFQQPTLTRNHATN